MNFAICLAEFPDRYHEADQYFKEALSLNSSDPDIPGYYAVFLAEKRRIDNEAEKHYLLALNLSPNDPIHAANYAEFLLVRGRLDESRTYLETAKQFQDDDNSFYDAQKVAIHLNSLLLATISGEDGIADLQILKKIFSIGVRRGSWNFSDLLSYAKKRLQQEDYDLLSAMACGIHDKDQFPTVLRLLDKKLNPKMKQIGTQGKKKTTGSSKRKQLKKKTPTRKSTKKRKKSS